MGNAAFAQLVQEAFDRMLSINPVLATQLGIHDYDDRLNDLSPDALAAAVGYCRQVIDRLRAFGDSDLSIDEQVDRDLALINLEQYCLDNVERRQPFTNPTIYVQMAMFGCHQLIANDYLPLSQRLPNLIARLEAIPNLLSQARTNLQNPPRLWTETAIMMAKGGAGFLGQAVPALAEQLSAHADAVRRAARAAGQAMADFVDFLQELHPRSQGDFALGRIAFDYRLRRMHMLEHDTDSLIVEGQRLVAETEAALKRQAALIDPASTWQAISAQCKAQHPAPDEILATYRREMERSREFVLSHNLVDLPAGERLDVVPTPSYLAPLVPYAAYLPPGPYAPQQKGLFWVTPVAAAAPPEVQAQQLQGHCIYAIPITAVHEGYPGHHLQFCRANQNPSVVRHLVNSTLFVEGWAFYCEELMEEQGFLTDPRTRLLRLKDQLWRACRIVIDASLHSGRMSTAAAEAMLVEVAQVEPANARTEVTRYTLTPTQPMAYLMGKLALLELADAYRRRAGTRFSLKEFHNDLLAHGSLPPALLHRLLGKDDN